LKIKFKEKVRIEIREDSYITKLLVLKTITVSLETLKERYLTQIGDIIPYVSELLEDSNTEVKKIFS